MPTRRARRAIHAVPLSARESILFEAGIKLGGVFHQYLGTPVSRRTAPGLARAIESAVRLQPYVDAVRVRIAPHRGGPLGSGRFAYRYLTAEMLDVTVTLRRGATGVVARLRHRPDLRYPLMRVERIDPPRASSAARAGRSRGRRGRRTGPSAG